MFYDISRCITIFYRCFMDVLLCFMMFSESHNDQYRRIGDRADADRHRDRDNVAGIGDNSAEIGDNSTEIGDDAAYLRKSDPMLNYVLSRF